MVVFRLCVASCCHSAVIVASCTKRHYKEHNVATGIIKGVLWLVALQWQNCSN